MSSAQSLLGLVNHLQSMEMSFTEILMESALKLGSLTDANIFVLVETQEGRRFCGRRHLCDAYRGRGLCAIGNDLEYEIDPSVSSLHLRREKDNFPSMSSFTVPPSNPPVPPHFSPTHPSALSNRKRPSQANLQTSPTKQFRFSMEPESLGESTDEDAVVLVDVKAEEVEARLAAGEEMAGETPVEAPGSGDMVSRSFLPENLTSYDVASPQETRDDFSNSSWGAGLVSPSSAAHAVSLAAKSDCFLDSFARKAAVDKLSLDQRLDIMKRLAPDVLLRPGATETEDYLVFQKVCYEFCRACALECPVEEPVVEHYFDKHFSNFANMFPLLASNVEVLNLMRVLTKRSYKQYLKTRGRRKNDHSKMANFFK